MKDFHQPRISSPFVVRLQEPVKRSIPSTWEQTAPLRAQQRVCAWCNIVMREGTKPATHGMCPKCLEEQMRNLEEQNSRSRLEAPAREIFSQQTKSCVQ